MFFGISSLSRARVTIAASILRGSSTLLRTILRMRGFRSASVHHCIAILRPLRSRGSSNALETVDQSSEDLWYLLLRACFENDFAIAGVALRRDRFDHLLFALEVPL
jgi:hypothetical protein